MQVSDEEMLRSLEARDGPLPARTRSHWSTGECRYTEIMDGRPCPWCEAERRRQTEETGST